MNAHAAVSADYDKVSGDPRIISLEMEPIMQTAKDAYDKLLNNHEEVDKWKANEWTEKVNLVDADIKVYNDAFENMMMYHESLKVVLGQKKGILKFSKHCQPMYIQIHTYKKPSNLQIYNTQSYF